MTTTVDNRDLPAPAEAGSNHEASLQGRVLLSDVPDAATLALPEPAPAVPFAEGESLRSALNRLGRFPLRKALDVTLQICAGLKQAHALGSPCQGLKSENVMIDSRGNVKIMSLGIAATNAAAGAEPEPDFTHPGDARVDIYRLGLVLYEIFTGQQAFVAGNTEQAASPSAQRTLVSPHEMEPAIPVSIERAILKCLDDNPEKRFQNIAEVEEALTSSGTRAVLASPCEPAPTLANREAIAHPAATAVRPIMRAGSPLTRVPPFAWIVLAGCIAAGAGGLHWMGAWRAAQNLPPPSRLPAPAPPDFALEKDEPAGIKSERGLARPSIPADSAAGANPPQSGAVVAAPTGQQSANSAGGANYLWIGRFLAEGVAREAADKIEKLGLPALVVRRRNPNGEFFVVLSGPFAPGETSGAMQQLGDSGFVGVHPIRNLILDQTLNP